MDYARTIVSTSAAVAASTVFLRTFVYDFLPDEFRSYLCSAISRAYTRISSQFTILIVESEGLKTNPVYKAAEIYLATKISPSTTKLRVTQEDGEKTLVVTMERGEELVDHYEGIPFKWQLLCQPLQRASNAAASAVSVSESRSFRLSFHRKHKDKALRSYLPFVLDRSEAIKAETTAIKIHLGRYEELFSGGNLARVWTPMLFDHPATFDTLAMEPELKREVMEDLKRFANGKMYYKSRGRVWKRGYLMYGPPGTGKSSLIAAMANFLKYYVYNVELSEMYCNSDLERLLVSTSSRSILVVEDIDCNIELENREAENNNPKRASKVTLSGLLNFIDGLWSCCGDGRIIVFTTNHKDRLDPALLRPGRMDMHIHMSYCSPFMFKKLASNYLGINSHPLFGAIEGLIQQVEVTPAEIAGELMKSDDPETALTCVVKFLQKKIEDGKSKALSGIVEVTRKDEEIRTNLMM